MEFTPQHAAKLLDFIYQRHCVQNLIDAGCLEAVAALHAFIAKPQYTEVWINIHDARWIEGIKMYRALTGCGLKEAKDWSDRVNPYHTSGQYGPVLTVMDGGEDLKARFDECKDFKHINNVNFVFKPVPAPRTRIVC